MNKLLSSLSAHAQRPQLSAQKLVAPAAGSSCGAPHWPEDLLAGWVWCLQQSPPPSDELRNEDAGN